MESKFKIICLECGSDDVSIQAEIDYDWDENPYISGYYLQCHDCDNCNL